MKNWTHGHSLLAGILVGFTVAQRPWVIFGAGILVGIAGITVWKWGRKVTGGLALIVAEKLAKRKPVIDYERRVTVRGHEEYARRKR